MSTRLCDYVESCGDEFKRSLHGYLSGPQPSIEQHALAGMLEAIMMLQLQTAREVDRTSSRLSNLYEDLDDAAKILDATPYQDVGPHMLVSAARAYLDRGSR